MANSRLQDVNAYSSLTKIVTLFAGVIAVIVLLAIPLGYGLIAYRYEAEALQSEANLVADKVSEIIYANPALWSFQEHRLVGTLLQHSGHKDVHDAKIIDMKGKSIARLPAKLAKPTFSFTIDLTDGKDMVGKVVIEKSLRPLLLKTTIAALLSALLSLAIYFALKILPLRALTRVLAKLEESQQTLRTEINAKELALRSAKDLGLAMRHQALHDALTNLPNRVLLYDRLQQAILLCLREKQTLSLIMVDLDRFKNINDTLGHHIGDLVLQQIAQRVPNVLRSSDTVARLGGDEFAILLKGISTHPQAVLTAEKILEAIRQPINIEHRALHVSASLGIVLFPEHGTDPPHLMRCADIAMYSAKRAKAGFAFYDAAQDLQNTKQMVLQNDLYEAIVDSKQLVLYYQPKIDLRTKRICGVEALIRWWHPQEGLIFPDDFIPAAEQSGLIRALTRRVLDLALQESSEWQKKELPMPLAINISGENLQDPTFPSQVAEALTAHAVHPSLLEMEITESALMQDPVCAITAIQTLREMGILISIDDFGTGYSSLAYLKKLAVSQIKVDKSFVMDMIENDNDAIIVPSTIDLAHNLGLRVVAEGVESEEILKQLIAFGCDIAQGYYISPPLPIGQFCEWLQNSEYRALRLT